jgi:hypothetical protein
MTTILNLASDVNALRHSDELVASSGNRAEEPGKVNRPPCTDFRV